MKTGILSMALAVALFETVQAAAPVSSGFALDDIHFWVGEGENRCGVVVDWQGTAKAWGYRWNGTCTNLFEVVRRIAREDHRLNFSYQKMTASYVDLYFFGYDVNDGACQWLPKEGESSDAEALVGLEDSVAYSQWWVLYGPMNGSSFPTDAQTSAWTAANGQIPVDGDWFVFTIGSPEYDTNWNETPAILSIPTAAESPYGFEVVSCSTKATGDYAEPSNVLGRPTTCMNGQWGGPVSPYNSAWMADELLTLSGEDEDVVPQVSIKFDHDVMDDANNPWGIDFIVFGNAFGVGNSTSYYTQTTDPSKVSFAGTGASEESEVLVSQDGETWYSYTETKSADDFAPTLGYVYDTTTPETSLFSGNAWWGLPADACYPVNPSLGWSDFKGLTLAQVAQYYNGSAGGAGYDLAKFELNGQKLPVNAEGKRWIRYVRVQSVYLDDTGEGDSGWSEPEVDAVADVAPVSAYELWVERNYTDWTTAWDAAVTGPEVVVANGRSNAVNFFLGVSPGDTATELAFRVASFEPGEIVHTLTVVTNQKLADGCGLVVKRADSLSATSWASELPMIVSSTQQDDGSWLTQMMVPRDGGAFLKLALDVE